MTFRLFSRSLRALQTHVFSTPFCSAFRKSNAQPKDCVWLRTFFLCLLSCLITLLLLQPKLKCAPNLITSQQQALSLLQTNALCPRTDWRVAVAAHPEVWAQAHVFSGESPLPFYLALPPPEDSFVTQAMTTSGMWAPIKTAIFLHVLASVKVRQAARLVVDAGANLGYFSQLALSLGFEVASFEPQLRIQTYLAATAARNSNGARFHVYACALGSVRGHVRMQSSAEWEVARPDSVVPLQAALDEFAPGLKGGDAAAAQEVESMSRKSQSLAPMILLSDILQTGVPIALLKVNVEGAERGVMAGLSKALLAGVRNILVEAETTETRSYLRSRLRKAGFQCRQLQERYFEQNCTGHSVGGYLDTRMSHLMLGQVLTNFLTTCKDNGSEDYWFSREDYPWLCQTVGCDGGETELRESLEE